MRELAEAALWFLVLAMLAVLPILVIDGLWWAVALCVALAGYLVWRLWISGEPA